MLPKNIEAITPTFPSPLWRLGRNWKIGDSGERAFFRNHKAVILPWIEAG